MSDIEWTDCVADLRVDDGTADGLARQQLAHPEYHWSHSGGTIVIPERLSSGRVLCFYECRIVRVGKPKEEGKVEVPS